MSSFPLAAHTLFYFLLALVVLIAVHEAGHFIAARKLGVKVLRFSLGFGVTLFRYQASPNATEFVIGAIPLGGYVKMVDEREGAVAEPDLPFAFNRQSLLKRALIVVAGPVANLLLAFLLYWTVFVAGETGMRPVLGPVLPASLAAAAQFEEGDEIFSVEGVRTPIWGVALTTLLEKLTDSGSARVEVVTGAGEHRERLLTAPAEIVEHPELLHQQLGFQPRQPVLPAQLGRVIDGGSAERAGLQAGDLLLSVDDTPIKNWPFWVDFVRKHPEQALHLRYERDGVRLETVITPIAVDSPDGRVGQIGAAAYVSDEIKASMEVEYRLAPLPAVLAAWSQTLDLSGMTVRMLGRMLIGQASVDNLSGPISIAQYAGQSASMGLIHFIKFLAVVSVSLGVLNLMPIPVLDGGHLLLYLIEAVKGSPVSEQTQLYFQKLGIVLLVSLMLLAFFLDIKRVLA
jgi:regulator of sigma E protease